MQNAHIVTETVEGLRGRAAQLRQQVAGRSPKDEQRQESEYEAASNERIATQLEHATEESELVRAYEDSVSLIARVEESAITRGETAAGMYLRDRLESMLERMGIELGPQPSASPRGAVRKKN